MEIGRYYRFGNYYSTDVLIKIRVGAYKRKSKGRLSIINKPLSSERNSEVHSPGLLKQPYSINL